MAAALKRTSGLSARRECAWSTRRHDVLARAALAGEQHRHVLRRDARDDVHHALHRGALGDDGAPERRLRAQARVLEAQLAPVDGALHREHELVGVERLGDVVEGARLHRAPRRRAREPCAVSISTGTLGSLRAHPREHLHAVHARASPGRSAPRRRRAARTPPGPLAPPSHVSTTRPASLSTASSVKRSDASSSMTSTRLMAARRSQDAAAGDGLGVGLRVGARVAQRVGQRARRAWPSWAARSSRSFRSPARSCTPSGRRAARRGRARPPRRARCRPPWS